MDLTVLGMGDDALAAVTGSGGAGNVVIVSDAGAFSDSGSSIGIGDVRLEVCANRRIAANIATFVIP